MLVSFLWNPQNVTVRRQSLRTMVTLSPLCALGNMDRLTGGKHENSIPPANTVWGYNDHIQEISFGEGAYKTKGPLVL